MKKISTTQGSAGLAQFFLWKSKSAGQTPYTLTNISVRSNRTWLWEKLAVFSPSLPFCGHIFFQQNHKVLTSIFITLSHRHIVVNFPPHYFSLQLRICSWTSQKKILTVVWRYHLNFSLSLLFFRKASLVTRLSMLMMLRLLFEILFLSSKLWYRPQPINQPLLFLEMKEK